jgi:hypothetical protein
VLHQSVSNLQVKSAGLRDFHDPGGGYCLLGSIL